RNVTGVQTCALPIFVIPIDQTNGADIIARMAQSQMDMEVMFAGISLYQQHQANLEQMKQQAQRLEVAVSPMWFLSQEEYTQDNRSEERRVGKERRAR